MALQALALRQSAFALISESPTTEKRAPGSVHGTNPVGSLLKMSTAHYLTWIPLDPGGSLKFTPVRTPDLNNPGSTGFSGDEHWTLGSRVASLLA